MIKTLKDRISVVYFSLVIMIAIIGAIAVYNLFRLSTSINGLMTANYQSIKVVSNMIEKIERQDHAILLYLRFDNKKGLDSFVTSQSLFMKAFHVERNNITERGELELAELLNTSYMEYTKSFFQLQEIKDLHGQAAAFAFYNSKIRPQSEHIKSILKKLVALNEKSMFRSKDRATTNAHTLMYVILSISLFAAVGGLSLSRFFVGRFLKPVDKLKETVKLVQAGDLNQKAPIIYRDEIGELANEFNNMTLRLQQYERSTVGELMSERNKTLAIVKSISDPLIVLDPEFRILLINDMAENFFGIKEETVSNKHFLEVIRNGELFALISDLAKSEQGEAGQRIIPIQSQGEDYYFNVLVKPVNEINAMVDCIIVLFQNITQIKQLEKIKTDFIATVSHEFKTPLTSIMMGLSLLGEEKLGPLNRRQNETIAAIQEDGETLNTLVGDLLEISKVESGKSVFKIQPCSIEVLIENAVKQFAEEAQKKEIALKYCRPSDLPVTVHADPQKIVWVLNNLINNALKYTRAGDEITINSFIKQNEICVSVRDTGIGIPPEYQTQIFDRFSQVQGYDLEVRGTGLGLAIAKEIVEAHGGEIWCESEPKQGSSFTFTLPLGGSHEI